MNIFERLALEKEDDYWKTGPGYETPKYQSALANLYSDNPRHYLEEANKAGAKKPVQYMNGALAPYELGPSQNDQDIFNSAAIPMAPDKGVFTGEFPATMVETKETENLEDGSKKHVVTKKDGDGNSEVITKTLAATKKESKPKASFEGFDAESFFDNMALEKSDDYFKVGKGYEPPAHQGALANLYSDNARNFLAGPNKAGAEKPVQYMNGAKAPYEQGPSDADQSIFESARLLRDEEAAAKAALFKEDAMFDPDDPSSYPSGKVLTFPKEAVAEEIPASQEKETEKATGITVNDDGTVDEAEVNSKLDNETEIKNDETIINQTPAAVKSIKQLEEELKTLKQDPARRKKAYLNFLRDNGVLKEWRPQLFKALAGTAFRLLMGDGASDAFQYSFGRMQEKADAAAEAEAKLEEERIKAGESNTVEFGKDSKWVNLGTTKNPVKVKMTTRKDGVPVISYKGKILTYSDLAKMKIYPKEYYKPDVVEKHLNDVVNNLQQDISSLVTDQRFQDDDHINDYVNNLKAKNQILGGILELERDGVDIGPGMGSQWYQVLSNAADDFITNKTNKNSKFLNKSYINFVKDRITKARIQEAGINDTTEFLVPANKYEYIAPEGSEKNGKLVEMEDDPFELEEDAFAEMRENAEKWFNKFAKENSTLPGVSEAQINRDQMRVAYIAYVAEKERTGDDWMISAQAGYKAGYLPFMYWLRENT